MCDVCVPVWHYEKCVYITNSKKTSHIIMTELCCDNIFNALQCTTVSPNSSICQAWVDRIVRESPVWHTDGLQLMNLDCDGHAKQQTCYTGPNDRNLEHGTRHPSFHSSSAPGASRCGLLMPFFIFFWSVSVLSMGNCSFSSIFLQKLWTMNKMMNYEHITHYVLIYHHHLWNRLHFKQIAFYAIQLCSIMHFTAVLVILIRQQKKKRLAHISCAAYCELLSTEGCCFHWI